MGANMKQRIIKSAKEIFSDNGYTNVSMKDFADKLQMPPDDLPAHYNEKYKIAEAVYSDLYAHINEAILKSDININDPLLLLFTSMRIFYEIVLSDGKNAKFTCDILKQEQDRSIIFSFLYDIYWKIVKEYGIAISKMELKLMLSVDNAAQCELMVNYLNGNLKQFNMDDVFIFLQGMIPRSLKIDYSLIDETLLRSISVAKAIDKTDLLLLN